MYEFLTDLLLVFAESTMSTPHFAQPSNEFSLLHDDRARAANHFVANPLPPTDQLLRLPGLHRKPGKSIKNIRLTDP